MPSLIGTVAAPQHSVAAGVGLAVAAVISGVLVMRSREDEPAQSQGSAPGEAQGDTASVVRELAATTNVLLVPRPDQRPRPPPTRGKHPCHPWIQPHNPQQRLPDSGRS